MSVKHCVTKLCAQYVALAPQLKWSIGITCTNDRPLPKASLGCKVQALSL